MPDFAPVWWSKSSGVSSHIPPTRPLLARNSAMILALYSAGVSCIWAPLALPLHRCSKARNQRRRGQDQHTKRDDRERDGNIERRSRRKKLLRGDDDGDDGIQVMLINPSASRTSISPLLERTQESPKCSPDRTRSRQSRRKWPLSGVSS